MRAGECDLRKRKTHVRIVRVAQFNDIETRRAREERESPARAVRICWGGHLNARARVLYTH